MGTHRGQIFQIKLDDARFSFNPMIDGINPKSTLINGSKNITLADGGLRKRPGTTPDNSTAVSNNPQIMGIFDFIQRDASQFKVFATNAGKVYSNYTNEIKTGLSTSNYYDFASLGDNLYFTDGASALQLWGGSGNSANISSPPSDWATDGDFPQQLIVYGKGEHLAERLFTWTKKNKIFASIKGNGDDFTGTGKFYITLYPPSGEDITAMWVIENDLFAFTEKEAHVLLDSDSNQDNWAWSRAPFRAGAAHWRVISDTPFGVYIMSPDLEIYNISSLNYSGDYKIKSITQVDYIDRWIRANVDRSQIDKFFMQYDPRDLSLKVFMVGTNSSTINICLPFYFKKGVWGPPLDNENYDSGFKASCGAIIKVGDGDRQLQTGDYNGFIWKLNQVARNDNGNAITARGYLTIIDLDDARANKLWTRLWVVGVPDQATGTAGSLKLNYSVDGATQAPITETLIQEGVKWDSVDMVWDNFYWGAHSVDEAIYELGITGRRLWPKFEDDTLNHDMFITALYFDYDKLSYKPGLKT